MRTEGRILGVALALGLAACGGDPLKEANAALAAKDVAKGEALLQGVMAKQPELLEARMEHFVVCRYLAAQGEAAKQEAFQATAIADYDLLVKGYGISADYRDMEGSLKADPRSMAAFGAARRLLYGE